jgi:hypothetical protein
VLVMALLVLSIGFLKNIIDLLAEMLYLFNQFGVFIDLILSMGRLCMCGCKGKCYINRAQWLKSQAHLKRVVVGQLMEGSVVVVLDIRKALIPPMWILGFLHAQDMHHHPIDDLCLSINLRVVLDTSSTLRGA